MDTLELNTILEKIEQLVDEIESEGVNYTISNYLDNITENVEGLRNDYIICSECGYITSYDEIHVGSDEEFYCEDCIEDHSIIKAWHEHKGEFEFKTNNEEQPQYYRGFELEIECKSNKNNLLPILKRYQDEFFFEEDNSLDNGLEIISQPMSFEYWRAHGINDINALICEIECQQVITSWETGNCGLHVHFNKESYSTEALRHLIHLICNNTDYFKRISGRDNFEYCAPPSLSRYNLETLYNGDRYLMLNFTNNTIEFRLFRGTLNMESVYYTIEYCDYLLRYCEHLAKQQSIFYPIDYNIKGFEEWLKKTTTKYEDIMEFIQKRLNEDYYDEY